ncbi:iron-sulfur cluster repair di-iron protein [Chitinophaga polysaccharea]|uniref:iron-sulfur cluster repair di-iron protein n=1 Tax=Chitinophaga TaxID=79328 RepID=UPI001454F969|nr:MULTISPECIES: iron-sulfur cluster repair di-iron protein [Chitinophaga]NLR57498.1 iron-sulfur cluster repair di-iron protein [Chitinophaga polysaccharea]NLU95412.1 iron-sulfur cluster repair di-iron protein [Chitinophaga sp. Ak27]
MDINQQTIVGELVAADYRTAAVFKNRGIDFCCNGNRSIADACEKKHLDAGKLISDLQEVAAQTGSATADYNTWPLDLLADYIEKKHHRYVREKIMEIAPFLHKVRSVHGESHPELKEIEILFQESAEELTAHMHKEESVLFPFIRKMVAAGKMAVHAPFGTVQHPIHAMMQEHENEGERFRRIAVLTNNYTPPEDACNTYRVTYSLLKEYEADLHLHIHLENNILFPRAIALEQQQLAL